MAGAGRREAALCVGWEGGLQAVGAPQAGELGAADQCGWDVTHRRLHLKDLRC